MSDYPKVLYQFKQCAGQSFRPSNGTEGMMFDEAFCNNCIHEKWQHTLKDEDKKCDILSNALIYNQRDKEYPKEWQFSEDGWPICTAWVKWGWNRDDDDGNWNDPPEPEPEDPNQLCFPFILDQIENSQQETLQEVPVSL